MHIEIPMPVEETIWNATPVVPQLAARMLGGFCLMSGLVCVVSMQTVDPEMKFLMQATKPSGAMRPDGRPWGLGRDCFPNLSACAWKMHVAPSQYIVAADIKRLDFVILSVSRSCSRRDMEDDHRSARMRASEIPWLPNLAVF
jgi:hypothetical protein